MSLNKHYLCNRGQNAPKRGPHHFKRFVSLLVAMLLILGVAVGGTAAFIAMKTDSKVNAFAPSKVSCEVEEDFNGIAKENVAVTNTGDTQAYIRVAVNVTWMKNNENSNPADQTVTAQARGKTKITALLILKIRGGSKAQTAIGTINPPLHPARLPTGLLKAVGSFQPPLYRRVITFR